MIAGFGVDQLDIDAHAISAALDAALKDIAHVQLGPPAADPFKPRRTDRAERRSQRLRQLWLRRRRRRRRLARGACRIRSRSMAIRPLIARPVRFSASIPREIDARSDP